MITDKNLRYIEKAMNGDANNEDWDKVIKMIIAQAKIFTWKLNISQYDKDDIVQEITLTLYERIMEGNINCLNVFETKRQFNAIIFNKINSYWRKVYKTKARTYMPSHENDTLEAIPTSFMTPEEQRIAHEEACYELKLICEMNSAKTAVAYLLNKWYELPPREIEKQFNGLLLSEIARSIENEVNESFIEKVPYDTFSSLHEKIRALKESEKNFNMTSTNISNNMYRVEERNEGARTR